MAGALVQERRPTGKVERDEFNTTFSDRKETPKDSTPPTSLDGVVLRGLAPGSSLFNRELLIELCNNHEDRDKVATLGTKYKAALSSDPEAPKFLLPMVLKAENSITPGQRLAAEIIATQISSKETAGLLFTLISDLRTTGRTESHGAGVMELFKNRLANDSVLERSLTDLVETGPTGWRTLRAAMKLEGSAGVSTTAVRLLITAAQTAGASALTGFIGALPSSIVSLPFYSAAGAQTAAARAIMDGGVAVCAILGACAYGYNFLFGRKSSESSDATLAKLAAVVAEHHEDPKTTSRLLKILQKESVPYGTKNALMEGLRSNKCPAVKKHLVAALEAAVSPDSKTDIPVVGNLISVSDAHHPPVKQILTYARNNHWDESVRNAANRKLESLQPQKA